MKEVRSEEVQLAKAKTSRTSIIQVLNHPEGCSVI